MDLKEQQTENIKAKRKHIKLSVFDFDGTLVDTPLPVMIQSGKDMVASSPVWTEKTGTSWPHKGWWSKKESLDMTIFDIPTLPDVISAYESEVSNPNNMVIMLTGRRQSLSNEVEAVLEAKGLKFNQYLYNYGGETCANKMEQMERILVENPTIRHIEAWDDRDPHIPIFQAWGDELVQSGKLDSFKINHVLSVHHGETI